MNSVISRNYGLLSHVLKNSTLSVVSLFVASMLLSVNAQAQWAKVTTLNATEIQSIAIDPTNRNSMFVGTSCIGATTVNSITTCSTLSGLYSSSNAGLSWSQVNDNNLKSKSIKSIVVVPDNIATTKKIFVSVDGGGVYKSTNGGINWISAPLSTINNPITRTENISQIIVTNKIGNQQAIYALVESDGEGAGFAGIYLSIDEGNSWKQIYTGTDILKLVVPSNLPGTLYISTNNTGEIRRANVDLTSASPIANFASITSGLSSVTAEFIIDPSNSNNLYARSFGNNVNGFYRSTNGGDSWSALSTNVFSKLAIDTSQTPTKIYGSKDDSVTSGQSLIYVYSSTDGVNWAKDDLNQVAFNSPITVLVAGNNSVYAGLSDGLYSNTGTTTTTTGLNVSLTASATPASVVANNQITYTITATNTGTTNAGAFTITSNTALPSGTTVASSNPLNVCTITQSNTVSCNVQALNASQNFPITLTVQLPATLPQGQTSIPMTFVANINDTNMQDNTAPQINTLITGSIVTGPVANAGAANVIAGSVAGTYNLSASPVGQQFTYTIISGGKYGTVAFTAPNSGSTNQSINPQFRYTPFANVPTGTKDEIVFQVMDSQSNQSQNKFIFTFTNNGPSSSPIAGGPTSSEGGSGAIHPLILIMFGLILGVRRFK